MQQFTKNSLDSLSDVFCAWMGFVPDTDAEIKEFMSQNPDTLRMLSHRDIEQVIHYNAGFSEETVEAMYSLLPVKLKLADGTMFTLFEKRFKELNAAVLRKSNSSILNIDMFRAFRVFEEKYPAKYKTINANSHKFKTENKREKLRETARKAYRRRVANMSEEEKAEYRKIARERARKRRENPEVAAAEAEKQRERRKNRSEPQKITEKIASRVRNRAYRAQNRTKILQRAHERRQRLKEDNPELLKEMDRAANARANRKENGRRYYQKHKEELALKARNNPKAAGYKRKYKAKKRFQEKTGAKVMSLLQAIIAAKQRNG